MDTRTTLAKVVEQIERSTLLIVLTISAVAAAVGVRLSFGQRLWLDEIMTVLIVKLPRAEQIWAVCSSGADNQPPAYDFLLRATVHLLRNDALGTRLPSLCGFLLGALCLYWFVRTATETRLYGLIAFLFSLTSGAWYFATEGRPYGLVFGASALAAVCWQRSIRSKARLPWLVAFSFMLAAALNLHYYSVLVFFPFAFAELVRTYRRRSFDFVFWAAWAIPALALLPYLSLIRVSRIRSGIPDAYFARPTFFAALSAMVDLFFSSCVIPIVAMGAIYVAFRFLSASTARNRTSSEQEPDRLLHSETFLSEAAVVVGFAGLPFAGIVFSVYGTHIFFPRYFIASTFGCSALAALVFALGCQRRAGPAVLASLVFALFALHNLAVLWDEAGWWAKNPAPGVILHRIPTQALESSVPIVVPYVDDFMQFQYYADPALRQRLFYLSSEAFAKQRLRFTFHERMMIGSAPFFKTNVVPYADFKKGHRLFYVFGGLSTPDWVVPQLLTDGAQLQLVQGGIEAPEGLFHVPVVYAKLPAP